MEDRHSTVQIELPKFITEEREDLPLISNGPKRATHKSDVPGAVFNLATSIVGAGIMALPAATKVLGLVPGILSILLMGLLSQHSIELLTRFSAQSGSATYGAAVRAALGGSARAAAEACILINNAGILTVYLIIIGDVMSGSPDHTGFLYQHLGRGIWEDRRLIILLVLIIFIAPLCALERIDSLSITSAASFALAVFFVIVSCAMATARFFQGTSLSPRMWPDLSSRDGLLELMVVIPIMTNAFVCHFNVQPIYNELRDPSPEKMNRVSRITTALCVSVYACTAVSGYILFGEETEYDVLVNFDRDPGIRFGSALNDLVRIGYILHLILVFPVIHFSLRETMAGLIFRGKSERWKRLALTAVLLTVIYVGSTTIPNIGVAFRFTGATTGLSLGFIFPALTALKTKDPEKKMLGSVERNLAWVMLAMAAVAGVVGVVGNVFRLVGDSS